MPRSYPGAESGMWARKRLVWADIRFALQADRLHWAQRGYRFPELERGYHATMLYRISYLARERGWRTTAWLLWLINHCWTGADLPPSSRIGGGLFMPHPIGIVIAGAVGRNVAIGMQAVIGGLWKAPDRDIGGGPGLPVVGDEVILDAKALVLGPVRVGNRTRITSGSLVRKDVGANCLVMLGAGDHG